MYLALFQVLRIERWIDQPALTELSVRQESQTKYMIKELVI